MLCPHFTNGDMEVQGTADSHLTELLCSSQQPTLPSSPRFPLPPSQRVQPRSQGPPMLKGAWSSFSDHLSPPSASYYQTSPSKEPWIEEPRVYPQRGEAVTTTVCHLAVWSRRLRYLDSILTVLGQFKTSTFPLPCPVPDTLWGREAQ